MARAAVKASALTTLTIGSIEVPVALYNAHADPTKKMVSFDKAGPHGGALKLQQIARAVPVAETAEMPDEPVVRHDVIEDAPAMDAAEPERVAPHLRALQDNLAGSTWRAGVGEESGPDGEYGRQLVEEGSGAIVMPEDVRRGIRLDDGRFIDCTEQIAAIEESTKLDRMDVLAFVDISQVPRASMKGAYYVGAGDESAPKPLRLIFEALKFTRRAAVVKLTKRSRQTLGVIAWRGDVLVLYELVWSEDLREPPAKAKAIQRAQVSQTEVSMACKLVSAMSAPVSVIDELRDDAIELRERLHAAALAGEVEGVIVPEKPPEVDVMAQLEASLAAVK